MRTAAIKQKLSVFLISALLAGLLTACGDGGNHADGGAKSEGQPGTEQSAGKPEAEEAAESAAASTNEALQENEETAVYGVLETGDEAPDFTAALADGSTFTLSEQKGKVVLLNFWATWCGPCVREMPALEKLHGEYGEDAAILAVNCMEEEGMVDAFLEENGYTFPIAYDAEGEIVMKYPSQGIPYTLVIDGDGVIRQIYVGAADAETQYLEYKGAIDTVLGDTE